MNELTVVIPCLFEKPLLRPRLELIIGRLERPDIAQIIVVDAFNDVESADLAASLGVLYVFTDFARRSVQLNFGADKAKKDSILFFLHIDSIPPERFDTLIRKSLADWAESGCFRLSFDGGGWFLRIFSWFSRFNWLIARGGDQGLFVEYGTFYAVGGFKSDFPVMEDIELCRLLLRKKTFQIIPEKIITSARKYERVGLFKLQAVFTLMHVYHWFGRPIEEVYSVYRKYIN